MKELSIEEKAKAYDKAIALAKHIHKFSSDPVDIKRMEQIFSELKESKDEEIRKEIIEQINLLKAATLSDLKVNQFNSWIAWLEKQGEQNLVDKDEPKFHKGEWIVHHGTENIYQVAAVINNQYQLKYGDNYTVQKCADVDRCARLWDITKDAKDGDVLAVNNEIFIYAHRKQMYSIAVAQCFVDSAGGFYLDGEFGYTEKGNSIHPATKEQRDLLFQKMKEAGYQWDVEKKELKEIIDVKKNLQDNSFRRMFEQKSVCSEEQCQKESLSDIENRILNFAMQFHDNRMKPESEWIDEAKMLRDIIPSIHKTS